MSGAEQEVRRALKRAIDDVLVGRIEEIEGRVPTDAEVRLHVKVMLFDNGERHLSWKGRRVVRVIPPCKGRPRFLIIPQ